MDYGANRTEMCYDKLESIRESVRVNDKNALRYARASSRQLESFAQHIGTYNFEHMVPEETSPPTNKRKNHDVLYKPNQKHKSFQSVWEEWNGQAEYTAINIGIYTSLNIGFEGGIRKLEENNKNRWRQAFSSQEQKHFSRLKYVMEYCDSQIKKGIRIEETIKELDMYPLASLSAAEKGLKIKLRNS
jgi:hypothetical protein